jgi:quinoprotein relay system zinc metallohydrolase 2
MDISTMNRFNQFFVYTLLLIASTSLIAGTSYEMNEVGNGIYFHQGVHEDANEANMGAIANISFVVGDTCVAVIDSGGSFLEGQHLREQIAKTTALPVCYVINTHVHPDHLFGNAAFKKDNPSYVGHSRLTNAIEARKSFFEEAFQITLGAAYPGTEFISPTITVELGQPYTLDLGNRTLLLTAYQTGHTDHDLTVFDDKTKTLWTGDLLFVERIPVMDGSINGWLTIMEQLLAMDIKQVIPGHGPLQKETWKQAIETQHTYFNEMRTQIRQIINDFGTIEQATSSVGIEQHDKWELFDEYHRRNITASFVELEWE